MTKYNVVLQDERILTIVAENVVAGSNHYVFTRLTPAGDDYNVALIPRTLVQYVVPAEDGD